VRGLGTQHHGQTKNGTTDPALHGDLLTTGWLLEGSRRADIRPRVAGKRPASRMFQIGNTSPSHWYALSCVI
jgi:hypothetical protein